MADTVPQRIAPGDVGPEEPAWIPYQDRELDATAAENKAGDIIQELMTRNAYRETGLRNLCGRYRIELIYKIVTSRDCLAADRCIFAHLAYSLIDSRQKLGIIANSDRSYTCMWWFRITVPAGREQASLDLLESSNPTMALMTFWFKLQDLLDFRYHGEPEDILLTLDAVYGIMCFDEHIAIILTQVIYYGLAVEFLCAPCLGDLHIQQLADTVQAYRGRYSFPKKRARNGNDVANPFFSTDDWEAAAPFFHGPAKPVFRNCGPYQYDLTQDMEEIEAEVDRQLDVVRMAMYAPADHGFVV